MKEDLGSTAAAVPIDPAAEKDALNWLTCVAEGDREGLVINAHTARRAAVIRWLLARPRLPAEPSEELLNCMRDAFNMRAAYRALYAHLTTPPKPKIKDDHIVICRNKATGAVSIFNHMGTSLMTASTAAERAKQWAADYPHMTYAAVKVPT